MARRSSADLPLHSGSAPRWLFDRMVDLSGAITEVILEDAGPDELLRRLADPYWFQAFGCVLGFDWHSSGVTTTTMGALKTAITPEEHGLAVVGGKGATARETPAELESTALPLSGGTRSDLQRTSRMSAAVDNGCVQDSYTLYHHTMVVTERGDWAVVQQGMNDSTARRYHWLSDTVASYVDEPHAAICAQDRRSDPLDLIAEGSAETRSISVDLVQDDPAHLKRELRGQRSLDEFVAGADGCTRRQGWTDIDRATLEMPAHHELRKSDLTDRALDQLQTAYEHQPDSYEALVDIEGIGKGSLRALALIAELIYDAGQSREDPAKYAYAHGGKDGTPYPVHRDRYDQSIEYLRELVAGSELDRDAKQTSLRRLAKLSDHEHTDG